MTNPAFVWECMMVGKGETATCEIMWPTDLQFYREARVHYIKKEIEAVYDFILHHPKHYLSTREGLLPEKQ